MFEIKGRIKVIHDTKQVSDSFKIRNFVLTDESTEYPQHISFQLSQNNCEKLDGLKVGDVATIKFNVRGREWTSPQGEVKYFNTLDVWFVQKGTSANNTQVKTPQPVDLDVDDDSLPF